MTPNNNLSVLPWYDDISFQNHRKSYAYGNIYPLFTPIKKVLPFQIIRPTRVNAVTLVELYDRQGVLVANITAQMLDTGLSIKRFESLGYDVIVYAGNFALTTNTPEGIYYLKLSDGVQSWWSDMFTMVRDTSGYIRIEWYDTADLVYDNGRIVYELPAFKNRLYICSEIGKPEYVFEEEGENRDGYFFPEKQISEKTYKFTFLAPEFLCDVMRIIRMSDKAFIRSKGQIFETDTFLMTPKWQTQGDIASVEIEFQCATVVKKIGKGYVLGTGGDFNNDFNDDFNNQNP